MDPKKLERSLYFLVRMVLLAVVYTPLVALVFRYNMAGLIKSELVLLLVGVLLFALELLIYNFLTQSFGLRLMFVGLMLVTLYFSYFLLAYPFKVLLVKENMILSGLNIYFLLFWFYIGVKRFAEELWDLDVP